MPLSGVPWYHSEPTQAAISVQGGVVAAAASRSVRCGRGATRSGGSGGLTRVGKSDGGIDGWRVASYDGVSVGLIVGVRVGASVGVADGRLPHKPSAEPSACADERVERAMPAVKNYLQWHL